MVVDAVPVYRKTEDSRVFNFGAPVQALVPWLLGESLEGLLHHFGRLTTCIMRVMALSEGEDCDLGGHGRRSSCSAVDRSTVLI